MHSHVSAIKQIGLFRGSDWLSWTERQRVPTLSNVGRLNAFASRNRRCAVPIKAGEAEAIQVALFMP